MDAYFEPSALLRKSVGDGNKLGVRTALHLEFNDNRLTGNDLRAASGWIQERFSDFFDPYKEDDFAKDMDGNRQNWSRDYYGLQSVYLVANFSEDRLLHLIDVRDLLREKNVDGFVALPPKPRATYASSSGNTQKEKKPNSDSKSPGSGHVFEHIGDVLVVIGEAIVYVGRKLCSSTRDKKV